MNFPAGSNLLCDGKPRVRRDWDLIGDHERELYLDAIETAIERGIHQRFAAYHADTKSDVQAHETCGFFLWHRRFLLAYENMLRSLGPRFACLTIPLWNIMDDFKEQQLEKCRAYESCASIVKIFGGQVDNDDFHYRTYSGYEADGHLHYKTPIQNLRDDEGRLGIIRYDMWFDPIPSSTSTSEIMRVFQASGSDHLKFWRNLQRGVHDNVHDTIGGHMRTPSSAIDPLFFPWHSTIDLFGYLWEICNHDPEINYLTRDTSSIQVSTERCLFTKDAKSFYSGFDFVSNEIYIKRGSKDIRDDPLIGRYFDDGIGMNFTNMAQVRPLDSHSLYTYASHHLQLRRDLENATEVCPGAIHFSDFDDIGTQIDAKKKVPKVSTAELLEFHQTWTQEAFEYWNTSYPDDTEARDRNMRFVACLLDVMDPDTLERWAIDDAFLEQVIKKEHVHHSSCDFYKNPNWNSANVDDDVDCLQNTTTDCGDFFVTGNAARQQQHMLVLPLLIAYFFGRR